MFLNTTTRLLTPVFALLILLCLGHPARAELLCDGLVIPYGTICCKGGRYCQPGNMCINGGAECLPLSSPRACSGGGYCDKGSVCAPERGKCVSEKAPRYCGGRSFCGQDEACVDDGKNCIKLSSERYCGNGNYCKPGQRCVGTDKCETIGAPRIDLNPRSGSGSGSGKAPISDACLHVGESKRVSGMIGECTKKDGSTGHWYFTMVRSTMAPGCPKEIEFDYLDPDDDTMPSFYTPFKVQTCDGPPIGIEVKK